MTADWENDIKWDKVKEGVSRYHKIMRCWNLNLKADWDDEEFRSFRRSFNGFYRLRRGESFQRKYYGFLFDNRNNTPNFESVLTAIRNSTGRTEASFSSKLLHTINPEMPIWDALVLKCLKESKDLDLLVPTYYDKNRFSKIIDCYHQIEDWYKQTLDSDTGERMIQIFDAKVPTSTDISKTKKIDFMLWQRGR